MNRNKLIVKLCHLFWPKPLCRKTRQAVIDAHDRVVKTPRDRCKSTCEEKVKPWAFVRVHNEARTLEATLNSIDGILEKGVIAHHGSTDGTVEIVEEFCRKHPGFIFYQYPHDVIPANDPRYKEDVPYENTLAAYYTAVLNHIPEDAWFVKVDGDLVFQKEAFEYSFTLPKKDRDVVSYSRLDVYVDYSVTPPEPYVLNYRRPGDQLLIKNKDLHYINEVRNNPGQKFEAFEILRQPKWNDCYHSECCVLHFPFEKKWRSIDLDVKQMTPFDDFMAKISDDEIDKSLINKDYVMNIIKTFR